MSACSTCGQPDDYHYHRNVLGAGRMADNPRAVLITLRREITDAELRVLPEILRWWCADRRRDHTPEDYANPIEATKRAAKIAEEDKP